VLRRTDGPKREKASRMRSSFISYTLQQMSVWWNSGGWGERECTLEGYEKCVQSTGHETCRETVSVGRQCLKGSQPNVVCVWHYRLTFSGSIQGPVTDCCQHGAEHQGHVNASNFLTASAFVVFPRASQLTEVVSSFSSIVITKKGKKVKLSRYRHAGVKVERILPTTHYWPLH
jgi:hypothetical protein